MQRFAQVHSETGFVVNVLLFEGPDPSAIFEIPAGFEMVEDTTASAGAGMTWDGTTFVPAPGLEPKPVQDQPAQQQQARAFSAFGGDGALLGGGDLPQGWRPTYARHMPPDRLLP